MLSRIYIDNYRAFVDFEHRFDSIQLLLGSNGAGKSSLMDALLSLRHLVVMGYKPDAIHLLRQRTRWTTNPLQTFELEMLAGGSRFVYRVEIEPEDSLPVRASIKNESLMSDGSLLFHFERGEVRLFDDSFAPKVEYPLDPHQSGLSSVRESVDNQRIFTFLREFEKLVCFRINPFLMEPVSEADNEHPTVSLSNFVSWYRHIALSSRREDAAFLESLRESMAGFDDLIITKYSESSHVMLSRFQPRGPQSKPVDFGIQQLSDGQRCLIALYAIAHFVVAKGGTVILDEPDNFVALRELQPWLNLIEDLASASGGQVILISHHPEFINQWAPEYGYTIFRDEAGNTRSKRFHVEQDAGLTAAELIARGWDDD